MSCRDAPTHAIGIKCNMYRMHARKVCRAYAAMQHCDICPSGYFASDHGLQSCDMCAVGKYQDEVMMLMRKLPQGLLHICHCKTNLRCLSKGYFTPNVSMSTCMHCIAGQFNPTIALERCFPCIRATSNASFLCPACAPGQYGADEEKLCEQCPIGFYTRGAQINCTKCEAGKYNNHSTAECTVCAVGYFASRAGNTHIDNCTECRALQHFACCY